MKHDNKPKKSAVRIVKKSQLKPKKPVVIPLLAKHSPKPHRCGACRFHESRCKQSYSRQVKKLAPFIMDPTLVPHYEHPNDFCDPEHKFRVMRDSYMVDSAKKAKEISQLRNQLKQLGSDYKKLEDENIKLQNEKDGTTPLTKPRNPKPANEPAGQSDRHQCPKCNKWYKNRASYYDHSQKCGLKWTCSECNKTIKKTSQGKHEKSCKAKREKFSFFL